MLNKFQFLTETQISKLKSMFLTESSALNLHQQYDKTYGRDLVGLVISIDKSDKKKFAEWVLKTSLITSIDGDEIKNDYIADGTLQKMFELTASGKFQAMSYKNLKYAYDAMEEYEEKIWIYRQHTKMKL